MILTKEQIDKINSLAPNEWQENEQGIFVQPSFIPTDIKEPVIYMRVLIGGYTGGTCWEDSNPHYFSTNEIHNFEVLDLVLNELKPNISYLCYKQIEKLIHTNEETEYEYYGNSNDFLVKYIILSELISLLDHFE